MIAPINPFVVDTWQYILWNQGYNSKQVRSAEIFIKNLNNLSILNFTGLSNVESGKAVIAQKYIDNPQSVTILGTVDYGQPNFVPSSISFANPISPPNPLYKSEDWKQTLKNQGYNSSDIQLATSLISKLNIPSGYDLVSLAKTYIQSNKNPS